MRRLVNLSDFCGRCFKPITPQDPDEREELLDSGASSCSCDCDCERDRNNHNGNGRRRSK